MFLRLLSSEIRKLTKHPLLLMRTLFLGSYTIALIEALALSELSQFNLDLAGPTVDSISMNDKAAAFNRHQGVALGLGYTQIIENLFIDK